MWHPGTDTGSFDPYYGVEKQTVSAPVPQLTGTAPSPNLGIPASEDNHVSHVQAIGRNNISSALPDQMPDPGPGPETRVKQKSSASSSN